MLLLKDNTLIKNFMAFESFAQSTVKKEKEKIYNDHNIDQESRNRDILEPFNAVELNFNDFTEKKISAEDFANNLGSIVFSEDKKTERPWHPSAQIYAFEHLLKALAETDDKKDIDEIVNEIIFDIGIQESSVKGEYLLGILANYAGKYNINALEERLKDNKNDVQPGQRFKIFKNIFQGISKENESLEKMKEHMPEMVEIIDLIKNDFPQNTDMGETARLVGRYYEMAQRDTTDTRDYKKDIMEEIANRVEKGEKEEEIKDDIKKREAFLRSATRYPKLKKIKETKTDNEKNKRTKSEIPDYLMRVPKGKVTSRKKIRESEEFNMCLGVALTYKVPGEKERVLERFFGDNHPEAHECVVRMRELKDTNDFSEIRRLMQETINHYWEEIDDGLKESFAWNKDNVVLQVLTIKDEPGRLLDDGVEDIVTN